MSTAIEATVKALVEFEAELDRARAEASDARRKATKDAGDWTEAARASAVAKAQEMAAERVAKAKEDAEAEAERIRKKGEADLKAFESSISKHRSKAADLVASRLLGEET
jgi:vacuolar-type H+-ATPase subunit H